ncbi:MAG TPA: hypothetical protein VLD65_02520 [Anaerolineales bacterium]|nr:hypothetical protein [Anaerolineales bacterium]
MNRSTRHFLNYKVIIGAIIFGVGIFAVLVAILWSAKASMIPQAPSTAILKVIEAPTQTPFGMLPTSTPTPTAAPTSSSQGAATPVGSDLITVGNYVKVSGTEGEGLRLHTSAGVSTKVNYVAIESELFLVKDGPIEADGYVWWELEDPYTNNAVGWGVSNYLVVVQNP